MYTYQIKELFEREDYIIECEDWLYIFRHSPQIKEVDYNSDEDNYYMETYDGYSAIFRVYNKKLGQSRYKF
jgi:hypothetical protein